MFWGLIMEPQKRYSQIVKKSFHVSMASLDICSCTEDAVQVMCGFENRKYLLCTLKKDGVLQCPLDLNFDAGDEVSFVTNGTSHVHLTGYLNDDPLDDLNDLEEEEEDEEEIIPDPILRKAGKITNQNIVPGKRQKKMTTEFEPPAKKTKTAKLLDEIPSQDEDDSDDSDVSLTELITNEALEEEDADDSLMTLDDDDLDDEDDSDEEDVDDDVDDEEESDAEEEDEVSSMSEDEVEPPKMNGSAKKNNQKANNLESAKAAGKKNEKGKKAENNKETSPNKVPAKRQVEGGVTVEDIKVGNGQLAKPGKMVQVYYEGRLKSNNKMFDSSKKGSGFKFRLGKQEVIKAWDVGVAGMKVGGKRKIICPPSMAYGQKGAPPQIPPNSTLVFEVELRNVN